MFKLKKENLFKYLTIAIIALFSVLVMVQSDKSFVLDEVDFPTVSNQTSQSGKPVYYHSEQSPEHTGTYHPTLYINIIAGFIRAFGFNETTIRAFGLICVLLSAYLLILISRLLIKKKPVLETLFLGVFLLNPYTISNATLPDIDPTVLPLVLLSFIYVCLRYVFKGDLFASRTVTVLGLLFALALWTKLTTPLILPVFLLALAWITSKKFWKSILLTIKISVLGIAVFLATYLIYTLALKLPLTYTYTFLWASFTKGTSSEGPIMGAINNLANFNTFIYWITIPLVIVLGVSVVSLVANKARNEKDKIIALLVITAALTTLFYIALMSPFGGYFKYPFPVFGLLLLSVVFMYDRFMSGTKVNLWYVAVALVAGFIIEKEVWGDSMFLSRIPLEMSALLLIVLIIIAGYFLLTRSKSVVKTATSTILILLLAFSIGFQLSISRAQAVAPYPTKYLYGQLGIDEASAYLRDNTAKDEVIWSMKDIARYSQRPNIESYAYYYDRSYDAKLVDMLKEGKVRYYVATTGIGEDNIDYYREVKDILNEYATKEKQYDNYVIYKAKSAKD